MIRDLEVKEFIDNSDRIYIYGAHAIASDFLQYLKLLGADNKVHSFLVTDMRGNPDMISEIPVLSIDDVSDTDASVVIATPEKFFGEIRYALCKRGFSSLLFLGNEGLSAITNPIVIEDLNRSYPELCAKQSDNEYICIDMMVGGKKVKYIPLTNLVLDDRSRQVLARVDADPATFYATNNDEIKVYVVTQNVGERDSYKSWERPIIAGSVHLDYALAEEYGDHIGDNISAKNSTYAEMTGVYWVWKNDRHRYKGICHYRRRYILDDFVMCAIGHGDVDAILTTPRLILPSVAEWIERTSSLSEECMEIIEETVAGRSATEGQLFSDFLRGNKLYPNNMVIAKSEVYDKYCEFVFSVLMDIDAAFKDAGLGNTRRYAAYAAELLTSFYFLKNDHLKVGFVEYELLGNNR